jgi:hypothetical protein
VVGTVYTVAVFRQKHRGVLPTVHSSTFSYTPDVGILYSFLSCMALNDIREE